MGGKIDWICAISFCAIVLYSTELAFALTSASLFETKYEC